MSISNLDQIKQQVEKAVESSPTSHKLYETKVYFLGKQGVFSSLMKQIGELPPGDRPKAGQKLNQLKTYLNQLYEEKKRVLEKRERTQQMNNEGVDLSFPGPQRSLGSTHPITQVISEIVDILSRIGFSIRSGPMVESDHYNFTALNIPENHPSRDMQDTFYVEGQGVLRTHTSPVQIRTMEKEPPPIRILSPGGVFRWDNDSSHSPHFHQIEALLVDHKVSMSDLKGTISFFVKEFFSTQVQTRFRPSFFPFTEPSAEVDCSCHICHGKGCSVCGYTGWVEIGGSGLVHPNVLNQVGLPHKKWQGFAFGFGVERMAMLKYGVNDIRLFTNNDLRFLKQFPQ